MVGLWRVWNVSEDPPSLCLGPGQRPASNIPSSFALTDAFNCTGDISRSFPLVIHWGLHVYILHLFSPLPLGASRGLLIDPLSTHRVAGFWRRLSTGHHLSFDTGFCRAHRQGRSHLLSKLFCLSRASAEGNVCLGTTYIRHVGRHLTF